MLEANIFNEFIRKTNHAHQQFCVWVYSNNKFNKYQGSWNRQAIPRKLFKLEEFSRDKGCRYKNFWGVVIPSLQHSWILSLSRLFDPAYHPIDRKKQKPRLSFDYILELLDDVSLVQLLQDKIPKDNKTVKSLREQRDNLLAHNDINFRNNKIEGGVENLFEELDNIISEIKRNKKHLANCNNVNLDYTDTLSHCGVDEIFEMLEKGHQLER